MKVKERTTTEITDAKQPVWANRYLDLQMQEEFWSFAEYESEVSAHLRAIALGWRIGVVNVTEGLGRTSNPCPNFLARYLGPRIKGRA